MGSWRKTRTHICGAYPTPLRAIVPQFFHLRIREIRYFAIILHGLGRLENARPLAALAAFAQSQRPSRRLGKITGVLWPTSSRSALSDTIPSVLLPLPS